MNATRRDLILQRWHVIQHEVLPELKQDLGPTTPKLERLIHLLEWVPQVPHFVPGFGGVAASHTP